MKQSISILMVLFLLTSCLSLKDTTPAPTLFLINAPYSKDNERKELPYSITIDKPKIVSGLNTDRIALVKDNGRVLDYFAEARWNGRLENIVQDFMIETLENQFRAVSVSDSVIDQKADYKILSHVRDFQAEYEDGNLKAIPNLHISMIISVLRLRDNKIITRFDVRETETARSNTLTDITDGLESLMQEGFIKIRAEIGRIK